MDVSLFRVRFAGFCGKNGLSEHDRQIALLKLDIGQYLIYEDLFSI